MLFHGVDQNNNEVMIDTFGSCYVEGDRVGLPASAMRPFSLAPPIRPC
jgi:hypothetical protein